MIYLDHCATTPIHPVVRRRMMEALDVDYGNPSSLHESGRAARAAGDHARPPGAGRVGCRERQVVFTSGGTEANHLALQGLFEAGLLKGKDVIVLSEIEHPSLRDLALWLERRRGARLRWVAVSPEGVLDLVAFEAALDSEVAVATVMTANNETGVLQPVSACAALAEAAEVPLHSDAVQAAPKMPLDFAGSGLAARPSARASVTWRAPRARASLRDRRCARDRWLWGGSRPAQAGA